MSGSMRGMRTRFFLFLIPVLALWNTRLAADTGSRVLEQTSGGEIREGTLEVLISDDFDAQSTQTLYRLRTDEGEILPLTLDAPRTDLQTGDKIRVVVRNGPLGWRASSIELLAKSVTAPDSSWTAGAKKALVILVNFANDTSQPYTVSQAQNTMFAATGSVAAYYAEASYGITTLSGDVTSWLTLPMSKPTTCDWSTIGSQAQTAATSAGYVLSNYQFPVYVFPRVSACGWAGLGYVGAGGAWVNQALSAYVAGHELGHNYGLMHAHSYDCGASTFGSSCARSEYGDPFDIMGGALRHFNVYSKQMMGWLPQASVAAISSGSGTFTLSPQQGSGGTRALKIPTSVGRTYWLEFRQASGFDAGLPANVTGGALLHVGPSSASGTDLLDGTPDGSSSGSFGDAGIDVGKSFIDAAAGLTVQTTAVAPGSLTLSVQFGTFPPPSLSGIAPSFGSAAGGTPITVTGSGFLPAAAVTIGGTAATATSYAGGSISATTRAHAVGDADVTITNGDGKSSTLPKAFFYDFTDVPVSNPFHDFVVRLVRHAVTAGCSGTAYCPANPVTRAQMAVFLLRSEHGSAWSPPAASGTVFADVSASSFAAAWIEALSAEAITAGCATNPLRFCPSSSVTRAQMAVFLLNGSHGSAYVPPPATGTIFSDVPLSNPFAAWIEEVAAEGISAGCGVAPLRYCPNDPVTRGQMAALLVTAFALP